MQCVWDVFTVHTVALPDGMVLRYDSKTLQSLNGNYRPLRALRRKLFYFGILKKTTKDIIPQRIPVRVTERRKSFKFNRQPSIASNRQERVLLALPRAPSLVSLLIASSLWDFSMFDRFAKKSIVSWICNATTPLTLYFWRKRGMTATQCVFDNYVKTVSTSQTLHVLVHGMTPWTLTTAVLLSFLQLV